MRLLIHSDASFLVDWDGKSNYGGFFYLGWNQSDEEEQKINGEIEVSASILPIIIYNIIIIATIKVSAPVLNSPRDYLLIA